MTQALATQQAAPARRTINDIIQSPKVREEIALALPKYLTPERMLRIALTTINRNPKLQECTPQSLLSSLMQSAQMGIEPDGRNGHLIPRFNSRAGVMECTFQPDYKGLVGLVRKNPDVADVYADLVCEADTFKITKGLHRDLIHEIDIRQPRGAILGAYAVIQYRDGGASFEFMAKEEIDAIRARSQSANAGPWVTDFGEMAKKTVLKRLLKLADLSADTAERVAIETEATVTPIERPRIESAPPMRQLAAATVEEDAPAQEAATPAEGNPTGADAEPPKNEPPAAAKKPRIPRPAKPAEPEPVKPKSEPAPVEEAGEVAGHAPPDAEPEPPSLPDQMLAQHRTATEAQLVHVMIRLNLAETTCKSLGAIAEPKLRLAISDPETIADELSRLPKPKPEDKPPFD